MKGFLKRLIWFPGVVLWLMFCGWPYWIVTGNDAMGPLDDFTDWVDE